jgi:DNA repair protein RAD7
MKKRPASDSDSELDDANQPSRVGRRRPRLNVEFCNECRCRFTVTGACKALPSGGYLCPTCSAATSGIGSGAQNKFGQQQHTTRRGTGRIKSRNQWIDDEEPVISLQTACIRAISEHIDEIESFGDLDEMNLDKICQIISKHRQLNERTLWLFLHPDRVEANFYDCAREYRQVVHHHGQLRICP